MLAIGLVASPSLGHKKPKKEKVIKTPSGLQYVDEVIGKGAVAEVGKTVSIRCVGKLADSTEFWATTAKYSYDQPLEFLVGSAAMVKGMDEGVRGMHVGGRRKIVIPPDLGYGDRGRAPAVPPKATLIFDVQMMGVK